MYFRWNKLISSGGRGGCKCHEDKDSLKFQVKDKKVKMKVAQSCLTLCDPMDNSPPGSFLSMGFSRQEYWSKLPFPSPEDLPNPEMEPRSPSLQEDSLPAESPRVHTELDPTMREKTYHKRENWDTWRNSILTVFNVLTLNNSTAVMSKRILVLKKYTLKYLVNGHGVCSLLPNGSEDTHTHTYGGGRGRRIIKYIKYR